MTGLSDLVALLIGKLYGKIQECAPLPTIIFAVLVHKFFHKYEPKSPGICTFLLFVMPAVLSGVFKQGTSSVLGPLFRMYAIFYATLISSIILYRLSPFHPLARYPGPVLAKISKLWIACLAWQGKQHIHYRNLHKKYGSVIRVGPNEIMISDVSVIVPLLGQGGWEKGPDRALRTSTADSFPDHTEHATRHRTRTGGFSPALLDDYERIVGGRVVQLTETLSARKSVDLARVFRFFSYDIMNDTVFGEESEMLRDGDLTGRLAATEARMKIATLIGHVPWLAGFLALVPAAAKYFNHLWQRYFNQGEERGRKGTEQNDVFYRLSGELEIEAEKVLSDTTPSDAALAAFTGSETTKTILSSLFYHLLCNRAKLDKLREEIDHFYPLGEPLSSKHLQDMKYLDACINETLRLSPPFPSGWQKGVGPTPDSSGGKTFGSYCFPEGTAISIHPFTILRDPRNFSPFTDEFWPERWLLAQGAMEVSSLIPNTNFTHNAAAFIPLPYGPADHAGKPLTMLGELQSSSDVPVMY